MLPDFPVLKLKLMHIWNEYVKHKQQEYAGFLSEIPSHRHYEGIRWLINREDGSESESNYEEASASFSVHYDEVPQLTPEKIARKLDEIAQNLADQMGQIFFKNVLEDMKTSDRLLGASERQFDRELVLEALDSIMISFDKQGNPDMPTIFVSPKVGEHIKGQIEQWDKDPELDIRMDQLIQRKKEEWRDRENSRRLVE